MLNYYGIKIPQEFYDSTHWSKAFRSWLHELELSHHYGTITFRFLLQQLEGTSDLVKKLSRKLLVLAGEERYKRFIELLRSIPGVGLIGALTILTEVGDIRRFKSMDQLCSYAGLVPTVYSSGETMHTGD